MANGETKKIGGGSDNDGETTEKVKRTAFDLTTALDADGASIPLNEDGQLTAVPANWDSAEHKGLKRSNFADDAPWLEYAIARQNERVERTRENLARAEQKVTDLTAELEELRKFGTAEQRKRAAKMRKMRDEYEALMAEMEAEGLGDAVEDLNS